MRNRVGAQARAAAYRSGLKPTRVRAPRSSTGRLIIDGWASISSTALAWSRSALLASSSLRKVVPATVEDDFPAVFVAPAVQAVTVDALGFVIMEFVGDGFVFEPGTRLFHGVTGFDAVKSVSH